MQYEMKQIPIGKIKPNPHRDLDRYQIDREKVDELKASIKANGFWPQVIVRKNGNGYQLAFGHHRMAALRELFDDNRKMPFLVAPLDEAEMIRTMGAENLESFSHNAAVTVETVRAVVLAFADGVIELGKPGSRHDQLRFAPNFRRGAGPDQGLPYSSTTILNFLGWEHERPIQAALSVLEDEEVGHLDQSAVDGLALQTAEVLGRASRRAEEKLLEAAEQEAARGNAEGSKKLKKEAKGFAKKTSAKVADRVRLGKETGNYTENDGGIRANQIPDAANEEAERVIAQHATPEINYEKEFRAINKWVHSFVNSDNHEKLELFIEHHEHLPEFERDRITDNLERVRDMAIKYLDKLNGIQYPDVIDAEYAEVEALGEGVMQ